jgi:DNA repair exonuclease SbcCD ATPase subunit
MAVQIEQLTYWNAFTYRQCTIPLANQGLVFLRGENGHGKSVPWEVLQHAGYGTTSRGLRKNGIVCTVPREDPDEERGFLAEMIVNRDSGKNAGRWLVRQSRDHGLWGTAVLIYREVGGEWRDKWPGGGCPKKLEDAQKFVSEILGLTQNEFEGCLYLSQSGTHTLIEGKPSEKMLYIAYLFGVDRYDKATKILKERLAKVEENLVGTVNLEGQVDTLRQQLAEMPSIADSEAELAQLSKLEVMSRASLKNWRHQRDVARDSLKVVEHRESLQAELHEIGDVDTSDIESVATDIKNLSTVREDLRDGIRVAKQRDDIAANLARTIKGLEPLDQFDDLDENIRGLHEERNNTRALIQQLVERADLEKKIAGLGAFGDADKLQDQITKAESALAVRRDKYRSGMDEHKQLEATIAEFKSGVCPTCKRPMNVEEMTARRDDLAEELNALYQSMQEPKAALVEMRSDLEAAKVGKRLRDALTKLPEGDLARQRDHLERTDATLTRVTAIQERVVTARALEAQLKKLPKTDHLSVLEDDLSEADSKLLDLRQLHKKLTQVLFIQSQLSKLVEVKRAKVERDILVADDAYAEVEKDGEDVRRRLTVVETMLANQRRLRDELGEVEAQVNALESIRRQQKVLQHAVTSLPKLKKRKLHKIVCAIRDVLPRYAGTMFSHEPNTSFMVDDDEESVELIARRMVKVHDTLEPVFIPVKGFSGGEKQRLSVALLFTLHSLLDPTKRPDVLILDEVDKGLDEKGIASLMALVNEVKNEYGTVIMTSHREQISGASFDRVWVVEKKNEESHLRTLQ